MNRQDKIELLKSLLRGDKPPAEVLAYVERETESIFEQSVRLAFAGGENGNHVLFLNSKYPEIKKRFEAEYLEYLKSFTRCPSVNELDELEYNFCTRFNRDIITEYSQITN